ncbi:MAG: hypothetical protein DBX91_02860 [Subdoligranulum variabile]|nr:MAG: hypothetical protein DBX91_02860 [Subdoligranulum variabile]
MAASPVDDRAVRGSGAGLRGRPGGVPGGGGRGGPGAQRPGAGPLCRTGPQRGGLLHPAPAHGAAATAEYRAP